MNCLGPEPRSGRHEVQTPKGLRLTFGHGVTFRTLLFSSEPDQTVALRAVRSSDRRSSSGPRSRLTFGLCRPFIKSAE